MKKSSLHQKANAVAPNDNKGAVAHNGKSASPKATNPNDPYLKSDANTMLYGNQDEVAQLIGRDEIIKCGAVK